MAGIRLHPSYIAFFTELWIHKTGLFVGHRGIVITEEEAIVSI
jgi:hypothetical protein